MVTGHVPPGRESLRTHIYSRSTSSCSTQRGSSIVKAYSNAPLVICLYPHPIPSTHTYLNTQTHTHLLRHTSLDMEQQIYSRTQREERTAWTMLYQTKRKERNAPCDFVIPPWNNSNVLQEQVHPSRQTVRKTLVRTHSGHWKRLWLSLGHRFV